MTEEERLIETVVSAERNVDSEGCPQASPAWHDLDDEGRRRAAEEAALSRDLESALDPQGLSQTGHRVLARIRDGHWPRID